jgi:hypothetical protein
MMAPVAHRLQLPRLVGVRTTLNKFALVGLPHKHEVVERGVFDNEPPGNFPWRLFEFR